jgi:hypothetical protein
MECPRCGKKFVIRYRLLRHLQNKTVCEPILSDISREDYVKNTLNEKLSEYRCQYCDKVYTRNDNLIRHYKSCKVKKANNNELDALKEQLKELKQCINVNSHNNTTINNNTVNNTVNNINIHIDRNPFGQEDLSMLDDEIMIRCVSMCSGGFSELLRAIHFDPKYPKNHNVFIPNKKEKIANVHLGNGVWELSSLENVEDKLYLNMDNIIYNYAQENPEKIGNRIAKIYYRFHDNLITNDELISKVQDAMCFVMISRRKMVEKDWKKDQLLIT